MYDSSLNFYIKHTNTTVPHSDLISESEFPLQNPTYLMKEEALHIYDLNEVPDYVEDSVEAVGDPRYKEVEMINIRSDLTDNPINIWISKDYRFLVVLSDLDNHIPYSSMQDKYFVGQRVYPKNYDREAYIISCDAYNPQYAVIVEYLDKNTYRLVLDSEVEYNVNYPEETQLEENNIVEIRKSLLEGRSPTL